MTPEVRRERANRHRRNAADARRRRQIFEALEQQQALVFAGPMERFFRVAPNTQTK